MAKRSPELVFTSLAHLIDLEWLLEAYRRTRKDGAVGVDGQTAADYEADLTTNLQSLLDRVHSGTYCAPQVRRVQIPKGNSRETRPIGIPTFEDKLLQRAVLMVLEPIFEQDFSDSSYGFRPGRSTHQAIAATWKQTMDLRGGFVLEVDLRKFFDTLDHGHLRTFLQRRVRDGVIQRLIGKWLNAGVMESGNISYPDCGSPQGGVISPLLANIYLHAVLDEWFHNDILPRMRARACLVRYADDAVMIFEVESDARRVLAVLGKRCSKYGLTIHPEKTRLVDFRRPLFSPGQSGNAPGRSETFDLLGFTHFWSRSRSGQRVVKRKTMSSRLTRAVQAVDRWCNAHRHDRLIDQHAALCRKIRGHDAYYGITGNGESLKKFRFLVHRIWRRWLSRRHRKRKLDWDQFNRLLTSFPLPPLRVVHSVLRRREANV
ncbi:group II intron reverse transcriptase/maturase [Planctomicrobium sp. SH527]|uniref:group II intron reverse transcriptase/maturase n=1 Tax=Planctomicrobium sp. SH527 TaxID=3448123 RepID=UPI003F5C151A